jgi:3-oxoacyl-[acyl-carrier-protein] synthase III
VNAGILGMGVYVPPLVRANTDWDEGVVTRWQQLARARVSGIAGQSAGAQMALRHVLASMADPFAGISQRYVMPADVSASDMEYAAATDAVAAAGIDARDVGLIICASAVPDRVGTNGACWLHHRLGGAPACTAISMDVACNAFLLALSLAASMLQSGAIRYALLVQSSATSRVLDYTRPGSQYFGDCAVATVVGPVSRQRGLFAGVVTHIDGRLNAAMAIGQRGAPWYGEGRAVLHMPDPVLGREFALATLDKMKAAADALFETAGCTPADVDFVSTHQGFPWMRQAFKDALGLSAARDVDTFATFGNCVGATVPLALAIAPREGLLRDDDVVFLGGLGAGVTTSAALLRWGA